MGEMYAIWGWLARDLSQPLPEGTGGFLGELTMGVLRPPSVTLM